MNRIDRLTAIIIILQSRRITTAGFIAERFEISKRTVYRDIRALQEIGTPIGGEAGLGYFLVDGYKLAPVAFSKEEAGALILSQKLAEKLTDRSLQRHYNQAIDKIRASLKTSHKDYLENLEGRIRVIDGFNSYDPDTGQHMSAIQNAIAERKVLEIGYRKLSAKEATKREIEPIGLVYYGNRWHTIAYCRLRKDYRDFRIDRIGDIRETEETYRMFVHKDLDAYFRELVREKEVKQAGVRFSKSVTPYIGAQKYYHGFVREEEKDGQVEMHFLMPDFEYFSRWLLMFAGAATVVYPEDLRTKLHGLATEISEHYLKAEED